MEKKRSIGTDEMKPRVAIGMFVYNEEKHVREALESLLGQTHTHFELVIVDDYSTDTTVSIIQSYAQKDSRISFYRNPKRQGYIHNYQRTFILAQPCDYFAWAAGHDRHHRDWLKQMIDILEKDEDCLLAYPLTVRIDGRGKPLRVVSPRFDTGEMRLIQRIDAVSKQGIGFGNMIYGLFRADALRKAGIFPPVLLPDVLLLWHLCLYGTFRQMLKPLWYRRYYSSDFDIHRQTRIAFSQQPWYLRVPWPVTNAAYILYTAAVRSYGTIGERAGAVLLSLRFLRRYWLKLPRDYPRVASALGVSGKPV